MGDDVVFDAVVDLACDNAPIEQIVLAAIGSVAKNALGPGARHPGNLHELIESCRIYIDALLRCRDGVRITTGGRRLMCRARKTVRKCAAERDHENSPEHPHFHLPILCHS